MNGFDVSLTLREDAVFSERSATEGGHRGLDYVPGATLLGAAAARLYADLAPVDAYTLFHSGKVRFGNALPVAADGEPAYPMPLCWHRAKGEQVLVGGLLEGSRIRNLAHPEVGDEPFGGRQPEQMRRGFVTRRGELLAPRLSLRMKTAIDPKTGRALDNALFGYDALPAGTRLRARVSVDPDVDPGLIAALRKALTGDLLLGRSRSAEYGRAEARPETTAQPPEHRSGRGGRTFTLWLLSDLAAVDGHGQPTLAPRPQWLGLPSGELVEERSFIRARRYSPWNGARGGPDLERQVMVQGSVLTFELDRGQALGSEHLVRIAAGLGVHREAGLGQVWLDPPLLAGLQPAFEPAGHIGAAPAEVAEQPASPLIEWLRGQRETTAGNEATQRRARRLAAGYAELLRSARRLRGLAEGTEAGPSRSQWGSVAAAARARGSALASALFGERDGVCKAGAPGWGDEYWDPTDKRTRHFADWLRDALGEPPDPRLTQALAREVQDVIKQEVRR